MSAPLVATREVRERTHAAGGGQRTVASPLSLGRARLMLAALLLVTLLLAIASIGLVRPLFVMGAAGVGFVAWRGGAARTVEVSMVLFSTAPLLRRIADLGLGYDPSGYMLLGPLLGILVPCLGLRDLIVVRGRDDGRLAPLVLMGICTSYGLFLSAFQGNLLPAATAAVKVFAPLLYGVWILRQAGRDGTIIEAAARAFMLVTPLMGLYAIWQYVSPSAWDRYWMFQSQMDSIGLPEPYSVRVFSTMNSPASYAAFSVCGLLLLGFCRNSWQAALLALPIMIGLLLSSSRSHWIALVVGVLYCGLFARTRSRSLMMIALIGLSILTAGLSDPEIADSILQRLDTLNGSVAQDGSGAARLDQFTVIYAALDKLVFGAGIAESGANLRVGMALDGEVASSIVRLGLVFGSIYLFSLGWAVVQGLACVRSHSRPQTIVAGAVLAGSLVQIPLVGITAGETGFLFWLFLGVAMASNAPTIATQWRPDA